MRRVFILILLAASALVISCGTTSHLEAEAGREGWNSNYGFVFVHGLSGWGHYDPQNSIIPYWGMKNGSLMKKLRKEGFAAYDASVDPYGSAWDRTCELYAQLTGSVTDYGAEHSARCGHERFGKDFSKEPLVPRWSKEHKLNLLGHSFGGVTIRLLAHLMAEGSQAERDATPEGQLSPLFAGGHADWIHSITAIAAPHNGTSAYHISGEKEREKFDPGESGIKDKRVAYDIASYDMHIQNAAEINGWLKTLDSVYYFSFPCSMTRLAADGTQEPEEAITEKMLLQSSRKMGAFEGTTADGFSLGREWQENDGLVNTISAKAPDFAPSQEFIAGTDASAIRKGIWYVMPTHRGSHMSLIGGYSIKNDVTGFYLVHLDRINRLP